MPLNWKCTICGLVVSGPAAPAHCPECAARREMFSISDEQPHGIAHNPIQPHDNHPRSDFGPGTAGCFEED
jgi:hypothetical protein